MSQFAVVNVGRAAWVTIALHVLCGVLLLSPGYIRPDSVATYAYVRSMVQDGDLSFFNEWASAGLITPEGITLFTEVSPVNVLANHWWIGASLISALPYALVRVIGVVTPALAPRDGFGALYGVMLAWVAVAMAAWSSLIAWRLLMAYSQLTGRAAALAVAATVIGTPWLWYAYRFPLGSHIAGIFSIALLLSGLLLRERSDSTAGLLAGLGTGLAIASRLQHGALLPAILFIAWRQRRPATFWQHAIAAGALPLLCQGVAWWAIYGTPLGPLQSGSNLSGSTYTSFHNIALISVLTSSYHGLFSWSPIAVLSVAGWLLMLRDRDSECRTVAIGLLLMFGAEWFVNGTMDRYFWGGMSFGARRFVDLAVPFAIGTGWFLQRAGSRIAAALIALSCAWSAALMISAHSGALSLARHVTGAELVRTAFAGEVWARAMRTPLRSPIANGELLLQSLVAIAILALLALAVWPLLRRNGHAVLASVAATALALVVIVVGAIRTPARAAASAVALRVDLETSRRAGPLIDQHRLHDDEATWAEATGRTDHAAATRAEIARIEALLRSMRKR